MQVKGLGAKKYYIELSEVEHQIVKELSVICGMDEKGVVGVMYKFAEHMAVSRILNPIGQGS